MGAGKFFFLGGCNNFDNDPVFLSRLADILSQTKTAPEGGFSYFRRLATVSTFWTYQSAWL
jgi:hypothetical protein